MVTGKLIRRAAFLIVIVTGVGCTGGAVGPETKAGDKPDAAPLALTLQAAENVTAVADQPHELAMRSLPAYRRSRPMSSPSTCRDWFLSAVPGEIYDVFDIHVSNALKDQPINDDYRVRPKGF